MASLFDPPGLTAARETARRDTRLLSRAYRDARRSGHSERAYAIAREADKNGLPVGRVSHDEEIAGVGEANYGRAYRNAGMEVPATGLDAYDHSQRGVGYDFRQAKDRPVAQSPLEDYRSAYKSMGSDPEAQDRLILRANMEGIPLSDYGRQRLLRSSILTGKNSTYQPGTAMPEGSAVPKAGSPITTPGQPVMPGAQDNAGVGQNFPSLLSKNKAPTTNLLPAPSAGTGVPGSYSSDAGPVQDGYQRFKGPLLTADQQLSQIRTRMAPYAAASEEAAARDRDAQADLDGFYARRGTTQEDSLGDEGLMRQRQERWARLGGLNTGYRMSRSYAVRDLRDSEDERRVNEGRLDGFLNPIPESDHAYNEDTLKKYDRLQKRSREYTPEQKRLLDKWQDSMR